MTTVDCYMEDGPLAGEVILREDSPPGIRLQAQDPNDKQSYAYSYAAQQLGAPMPTVRVIEVEYTREDYVLPSDEVPSRNECVTYFFRD